MQGLPPAAQSSALKSSEARAAAPLWIFGYGSLMWRPGFEFTDAVHARVEGWRRGFFIYSTHHRGTHRRPGLVLALDRGGACEGLAFRVEPAKAASTLGYLRAREQTNGVYREQMVHARLEDGSGRTIEALTFVAERRHPSYAGQLPLSAQVRLIRGACGISGPNLHYLVSTVRQLKSLGIQDAQLDRTMALAGPHFARKSEACDLQRVSQSLITHCRRHAATAPLMPPMERRRFVYRTQIAAWASASGSPASGDT